MKRSELLFQKTKRLWDETADHPFVTAMADGTLEARRFKAYMLQDYYYLKEYIEILEQMEAHASDETAAFLKKAAQSTRDEMNAVHMQHMKQLGITTREIQTTGKAPVCAEYLQYLRKTAQKGTVQGLTALLQCSWSYAYIARTVADRHRNELADSPYVGWFLSYTSEEYTNANAEWIDVLDRETEHIPRDEIKPLFLIFETCAQYENRFWNLFLES